VFLSHVSTKLVIATLKLAALGSIFVTEAVVGRIPVDNPWFWIAVVLFVEREVIRPMVAGMPEPHEGSTDFYIWAFRFFHAQLRMPTPYVLHRTFWHLFRLAENPAEEVIEREGKSRREP
jgi:hypothetical protein